MLVAFSVSLKYGGNFSPDVCLEYNVFVNIVVKVQDQRIRGITLNVKGKDLLWLDKKNKNLSPREGWSPIKDVILDIAERGRSLGVILIGAQQTASEIEKRILANSAIKVVGRMDSS